MVRTVLETDTITELIEVWGNAPSEFRLQCMAKLLQSLMEKITIGPDDELSLYHVRLSSLQSKR